MSVSLPVEARYEIGPELVGKIFRARLLRRPHLFVFITIVNLALFLGYAPSRIQRMKGGGLGFDDGLLLGVVLTFDYFFILIQIVAYAQAKKRFARLAGESFVCRVEKDALTNSHGGSSLTLAWRHIATIERFRDFWLFSTLSQPTVKNYLPSRSFSSDVRRYIETMVESAGGKISGTEAEA